MPNTPINQRAMSRLNAAALAVSLQGAIDEGQVKGHAKMRANALLDALKKDMAIMYKGTDPEIVVFHQISTMFDEIIRYLCNNDFMEEYEAKWAKIQEAIGNRVEVLTGWVSCENSLPEIEGEYLTYNKANDSQTV